MASRACDEASRRCADASYFIGDLGLRSVDRGIHACGGIVAALRAGMNDIIEIEITELHMICGGAGASHTTIRAPLSGAVNQRIGNVTINAPKGPQTMTWGANTLWGNFSWSWSVGK